MRTIRLMAPTIVALALLIGSPLTASAKTDRHTNGDWKGPTDQGYESMFVIDRTESGERVVLDFDVHLAFTCDEGPGDGTFGYCCGGIDVSDGTAEVDFGWLTWAVSLRHGVATGTARYHDEETPFGDHNCDSGLVRWRAVHLHPPG